METEAAALPIPLPFLPCAYSPYMNGDNGSSPPRSTSAADSDTPANGSSVGETGDEFALQLRCNGSSPTVATSGDSMPFKCHSLEREVSVQQNGSSTFDGKVVANADGVACFFLDEEADDVFELWPVTLNAFQYNSSESTTPPTIPSTFYPFDFIGLIGEKNSYFFQCCFPLRDLPSPAVLERYRKLPISISLPCESQSVFMCLPCNCKVLRNKEEFEQHARMQHDLSTDLGMYGGIIQKDVGGLAVVTSLLPATFENAKISASQEAMETERAPLPTEVPKTNGFIDADDSDHSVHSFPEDLTQSSHNHEETDLPMVNKSSSVECPKCDIVLGSSKSLGGHMTMVHSRNSSKKLKCPKCNWHYKYQETLEIHMKDKHPESEETCPYCLTNQPHPRLARGEVYNCGYKPFRCETCNYSTTSKGNLTIHMQSDKHVTNVQERQKNGGENGGSVEHTSVMPAEEAPSIPRSASTSSAREPFRCDVCGYETRVQRNLRIHLTSEKHQQNYSLFLQSQMNLHQNPGGLLDAGTMMLMNMGSEMMAHQYMMSTLPALNLVDPGHSRQAVDKIPENSNTLQCLVCVQFMADSYDELREHVTRDRSDIGGDSLIVNGPQSVCKYCLYKTPLKANFQLHCKTDKHLQKMQLVNHVREGGVDNEWRLQYLNTSNPVQVRCNACDYQTSSLHQLRSHLENNQQHEVNVAALVKLRDLQLDTGIHSGNVNAARENLLNASSALIPSSSSSPSTSTRKWKLFCSLCTFTAKLQSAFMQHVRSTAHWNQWKQHQADNVSHSDLAYFITAKPAESDLTTTNRKPAGNLHNGANQPDYSEYEEETDEDNTADPYDIENDNGVGNYSPSELDDSLNLDPERSSMLQSYVCPLCQESYSERNKLENHLISKHSVHAEALERLMMLVETSGIWNNGSNRSRSRDASPSSSDTEGAKALMSSGPSGDGDVYRCQKCAVTFNDIEQLYQHQNATGHLELTQTPRGPGYLCWKKGCNQYFKSATSLQVHFREIHARKTGEQRDMEEETGGVIDENSLAEPEVEDEMNNQALAENGYRDPQRKYKCHRCKVAFTKQIYLSAHNKTPMHRKGEKCNTSMEKYQDPNRPHKCEVCKESFTQKNILLVHFNSVAHLHKMKKYRLGGDGRMLENLMSLETTPPPAHPVSSTSTVTPVNTARKSSFDDENKPYRCAICQVAYASKSNLDIHWRSVAHQSRMAKSQQAVVMDLSKPNEDNSKAVSPVERRPLPAVQIKEEDIPVASKPRSLPPLESPVRTSIRPPFGRNRANFGWASMLENIGVEMVQQFLENGQKPVKKQRDTTLEPVEDENQRPTSAAENECSTCHKVFSSPWILKVHRESAHVDIVPIKILETVAAEYRKAFAAEKPKPKRPAEEPAAKPHEPPAKKVAAAPQSSSSPVPSAGYSADLLAAHMQLLPLLYPGVGGMNMMSMQAMMNLQPNLMSPNMNYSLSGFESLGLGNLSELSKSVGMSSSASKLMDLQSGQKRNRTRITDEQLQILRANFDIRNPPSDELLQRLCEQTGLELKVVKHWYRNTLFKERQRNKDSPYNFSVPPNPIGGEMETDEKPDEKCISPVTTEPAVLTSEVSFEPEEPKEKPVVISVVKREESVDSIDSRRSPADMRLQASMTPSPTPGSVALHGSGSGLRDDRHAGKRANRTRFTDFQVKALQDYFDKNAYPKDDDLEDLSRALGLSPRVITVWFQNARQKARKTYENQTPPEEEVPIIRTPSLNYQCKRCLQVFQRYYELIKHTRSGCSGTSAGLASGGGSSRDMDDANSVASTGSVASAKAGTSKNEAMTAQQQQKLWEASLGVSGVGSMLGVPPFIFPGLYPPNSPFGILQMEAVSSRGPQSGATSPFASKKRGASSDEEEDESPNNKRVRTTIQPEQLDYLYQQYKLDSNPSRKQLEIIAAKTGLKKRVAQVWYQNTRARERKGQLHLHQLTISKRCPVCRRHFKVRSALESHISVKHADIYCKGDVNIDELPDTDSESNDDRSGTSSPVPRRRTMDMAGMPVQSPSTSTAYLSNMNDSMVKYYGETVKKYLQNKPELAAMPMLQSNGLQENAKPAAGYAVETPLDLSSAHPKASSHYFQRESSGSGGAGERDYDDSRASSQERSLSSSAHHNQHGKPGKRFRTQMSNAQLKVMKRLFADYKTPTMGECDLVGREIGLQKRVVQVWFQNARAKEKKNKAPGTPENGSSADHCALCNIVYTPKLTVQDHLFTKGHLEMLKTVEECTEGPQIGASAMLQLAERSRERENRPVSSRKNGESERRNMEFETKKSGGHSKTDASASLQGQGQIPVGAFGDLSALMMGDPNMNMMAYAAMCAQAMNPYYNAAAMPGMLPYAGLGAAFYDPTIHGLPMDRLSLPGGVPEMIVAKLNDRSSPSGSSVAFGQDGKRLSDLKECISANDFACATAKQSDIGTVCRKCHLVFPTEENCTAHQASLCYPGTKTAKNILKLMQIHFHCTACQKSYPTVTEFRNHCNSSTHLKNRHEKPGLPSKRPSSSATDAVDRLARL